MRRVLLRYELRRALAKEQWVPYIRLAPAVQSVIDRALARMIEERRQDSSFDQVICESNPAPDGVTDAYKWRATHPVKVKLRVPLFELDCLICSEADPAFKYDRLRLYELVHWLRASQRVDTVADFLQEHDMIELTKLLKGLR